MSTKFVLIRATLIYAISDLRIVFKQMKYPMKDIIDYFKMV